jgi:hypothetical protein
MARKKKLNPVNVNLHPDQLRSAAETDYGTGVQARPPMFHEMSSASQRAIAEGFRRSMSNWKTRETRFAAEGNKGALEPGQISRLRDIDVTLDKAAGHLKTHWNRMMGAADRPGSAWYFGHNRRLVDLANKHHMDPDTVIDASGAMSPQNDPDSEYRAAAAMSDAIANGRVITDKQLGRRKVTTLTPDEMQAVTATSNIKNVSHATDFDLPGFRNAGTNRRAGWRTLSDPDYNAVQEMKSAKVHLYTGVTKLSEADSPLHHEYEARFWDQAAARDVRLGRAADKRKGITGSEAIRGVPDRVDLYGLMKGGADPTDPAYHHPILGTRGMAVPDTWMAGLLSGQEMHDLPESSSPAKAAGSQTATTSVNITGHTFMSPAAARKAGGKEFTGGAAWGMAALAAVQKGAQKAREPESQTNIPPVMMQEMTWVHARGEVAKSTEQMLNNGQFSGSKTASARARIGRLTRGTLEGLREFRGSQKEPVVERMETPGTFHRGYDNPLDTDTVTVKPQKAAETRAAGPTTISAPGLEEFHQHAGIPTDELSKRRSILNAQRDYAASRVGGGAAWHEPR